MRKIISKHEEEKKKKRNQFIIGGVLIFIMISSMLGYAFQSQLFDSTPAGATLTYNGLVFTNQNGFWVADYMNERVVFSYAPQQLPEHDLGNLTRSIDGFSGKPLYIFSEDANAESEIMFGFPFAEKIERACPTGIECDKDVQAKTCEENFIIIQNGNEGIREEQNCIFISGEGDNLIKLIDNILFKIFGIKE